MVTDRPEDRDFSSYREHGDLEAMARVFDAVAPKLLLVAAHLARDASAAEDLVQTTFLQALQDAERYDASKPLVPWLLGILSHRAGDLRRRERRRATTELGEPEDALDPQDLAASHEIRETIAQALDELSEPYREVLILRLTHGLEPTAIAHTLGRSPGTVRMQLKRGLEKLRRGLPRGVQLPVFLFGELGGGLGLVRETVLAQAGAAVTATATAASAASAASIWGIGIGGVLTMKAALIAAGVIGVSLIAWSLMGDRTERPAGFREAHATPVEPGEVAPAVIPSGSVEAAVVGTRRAATARSTGRADLRVRVTFEGDGAAAEDVGVYVRPQGGRALGIEARTDAEGVARFEELARGFYVVDLDRWNEDPVELEVVTDRQVDLTLPDGIDVEGLVVTREGVAVSGADVYRISANHHDYLQWLASTDEAGRFSVRDMALDTPLLARAAGYQPSASGRHRWASSPVRGERGVTVEMRLVMGAPGYSLRGRVLDEDSTGVPHALVAILVEEDTREDGISRLQRDQERRKAPDMEAFFVRSDENGRFTTDEVPEGEITVFARSVEQDASIGWALPIIAPGRDNTIDVTVSDGAEVFGTVTDDEGAPLEDFLVEAEWEGTRLLGQTEDYLGAFLADRVTETEKDGGYRLVGLLPGEYDLRVYLGAAPDRRELADHEVELAAEEAIQWNPVIEGGSELTVRVLDPGGESLSNWGLYLREGRDSVKGLTDADGRYRFRNMELREHRLMIFAPSDEKDRLGVIVRIMEDVLPGPEELVIRLEELEMPTAGLRGRVVDASGSPLTGGLDVGKTIRPRDDGSFEVTGLPARETRIALRQNREFHDQELGSFELVPHQVLDVGTLVPVEPAFLEIELALDDGGAIEEPRVELLPDGERRSTSLRDRDDSGVFRSHTLAPGDYELRVTAENVPFHRERITLIAGRTERKVVEIRRGRAQVFEIVLPPHPDAEGERDVDVYVYDTEGNEIIDRREDAEPEGGILRLSYFLNPGKYLVRVEDERVDGYRKTFEEAELEVQAHGSSQPLRIDFGTDTRRYYGRWD